jgi:hypothetical protein
MSIKSAHLRASLWNMMYAENERGSGRGVGGVGYEDDEDEEQPAKHEQDDEDYEERRMQRPRLACQGPLSLG